jgi:hypothetical protein
MIRELIIGVSVAVIGIGAHAASAQAAAPEACSWKECFVGEFCEDLGWEICRNDAPPGCVGVEAYCSGDWLPGCGGGGYLECDGIQIQ